MTLVSQIVSRTNSKDTPDFEEISFTNVGQDIRQIRGKIERIDRTNTFDKFPIGIKTPLRKGNLSNESLFSMHFDALDQVQDNLKNLIMTQKGERLGRGNFGTNLYEIFSKTNIENPDELAMQEISNTVSIYMPHVLLKDFESETTKNGPDDPIIYNINVFYTVPALSNEIKSISVKLRMTN